MLGLSVADLSNAFSTALAANAFGVRSANSAKHHLREMMLWDGAEKQHILRAALAGSFGFNPTEYAHPFPGSTPSTVNIMTNQQPAPDAKPPDPPPTPAVSPTPVPSASAPATAPANAPVSQTPQTGLSKWTKAGLVAAALLAGGGAGAGLTSWLMSGNTNTTQSVEKPYPYQWRLQWKVGADGKTQTTVVPVEAK